MPFVPDLSDRLVQVGFPAALAEELQTAIQGPVSGYGISYATLASTPGTTPGERRTLSDGPDAGAGLVWAIPEGSTSYAWCWAIYPLASYL